MNYNLHKMPNWFYEVAACISEYHLKTEDKIIENHNKFGISQEDMEKFFSKYKTYKEAVLNEILPVYNRYPSLEWLFKPVDYNADIDETIGLSIISYWGHNPTENLKDDFIHNMTIKYISSTISDIINHIGEVDIKIEGITDLL